MKYQFKLLAGTHAEGTEDFSAVGLNERKGDALPIVTSARELDKIFKNKFERIHSVIPAAPMAEEDDDDIEDDEDIDDTDDKGATDEDAPVITLKAVKRKPKMYDVVKVIDGESTDEAVNDGFLSRKDALALVNKGYSA